MEYERVTFGTTCMSCDLVYRESLDGNDNNEEYVCIRCGGLVILVSGERLATEPIESVEK